MYEVAFTELGKIQVSCIWPWATLTIILADSTALWLRTFAAVDVRLGSRTMQPAHSMFISNGGADGVFQYKAERSRSPQQFRRTAECDEVYFALVCRC